MFDPVYRASSFVDLTNVDVSQEDEMYIISRDLLARMVAAHTSGMFNAIPEQADFEHADAMIALLESRLSE